jgi:predicted patatin/cPLA2 family phospholipase
MSSPGVADLLNARREHGSLPQERDDPHRVALVIEGGGSRAAYSAGMALALDQSGLLNGVDEIYGTSGGALNAAWLLTGEGSQWLPSWAWESVAAAGVTNPRRLLRRGPLVDLARLTDHVYEHLTPMDFEAILRNPIGFHPIATSAETGRSADLAAHIVDRETLKAALRASACMPLLAGAPVTLGGHRWLDGGLAEPIPLPTAIAQGATHVLVFRTRRANQPVRDSTVERLALAPYFRRTAPGAGRAHRQRRATHRSIDLAITEMPGSNGVQFLQVRPPDDAHDVGRLTKDLAAIAEAVRIGEAAARTALGAHYSSPL